MIYPKSKAASRGQPTTADPTIDESLLLNPTFPICNLSPPLSLSGQSAVGFAAINNGSGNPQPPLATMVDLTLDPAITA